ncbi:cellulase family glycosylhydrolase [Deinococcus sp. A31D244]|uniref:cellulase family glycosylhydrolase n=1 Tax=Deinococcus sp. A31D244 TaxID=3397675 RepID=UPI0039DF35C0
MSRFLLPSALPLAAFLVTACASTPSVADTPAAPLQAQAAAGLYVANGKLVDANGVPFIFQGINFPHAWYAGKWSAAMGQMKARNANSVRMVLATGCRWTKTEYNMINDMISAARTNKLVLVLEVHDTTGYGEQAGACTLAHAANYWVGMKNSLVGHEKHVIINIGNEPYGNVNTAAWTADTKAAIQTLRSAGLRHTIMIDAPNWGQDWSNTMRNNAAGVFTADPLRNTIFSVHMYGVYNTASSVNNYISAFVNAKIPLVVGEFANTFQGSGVAYGTVMSDSKARVNGYMAWSWSGNSGADAPLDLVNNFNPSSPTAWGSILFKDLATAKPSTLF